MKSLEFLLEIHMRWTALDGTRHTMRCCFSFEKIKQKWSKRIHFEFTVLYHFSCANVIEMATDTYLSPYSILCEHLKCTSDFVFCCTPRNWIQFPSENIVYFQRENLDYCDDAIYFRVLTLRLKVLKSTSVEMVNVSTVNQTRVHNKWCIHAKGGSESLLKASSLKFALQLFVQSNMQRLCSHCSKFIPIWFRSSFIALKRCLNGASRLKQTNKHFYAKNIDDGNLK